MTMQGLPKKIEIYDVELIRDPVLSPYISLNYWQDPQNELAVLDYICAKNDINGEQWYRDWLRRCTVVRGRSTIIPHAMDQDSGDGPDAHIGMAIRWQSTVTHKTVDAFNTCFAVPEVWYDNDGMVHLKSVSLTHRPADPNLPPIKKAD